ncbi:cyclodeaminase/cyclohydrolase family protein [Clostridiaceae bacterium HSG29]|nr:cyclodeaminase/cyclohydrolase family protein [Clostridiaceae bacterium HSG29]
MLGDMYLKEFLEKTASKDPVPGGGSVAALSSALSASLAAMVANLTIGKKNYEEISDKMVEIAEALDLRRREFVQLIDKDANSFDSVLKAFKMPKETDEEKKLRTEAIQDGMKYAAKVPLGVAIDASKLFEYIEIVVKEGNKNAVTDGLVAAMMARTAIKSALYNVKINLSSIKDENFVNEMKVQVEELENFADKREKEILGLSEL